MPYPPGYEPLPTSETEDKQNLTSISRLSPQKKKLIVQVLAIAAIMYAAFSGLRHLARSAFGSYKFGMGNMPCHRNMSNITGLPSHFTLPSGDKIPAVALGVWRAGRGEVGDAVKAALNAGYRHIDGAWIYKNEAEVGQALKESSVPREEIWLTSKLWNSFHAPEDIESSLDESLSKLGTDYLDLPVAFHKDGTRGYDKALTLNPYPTWQKLEEMVEKGKVRNIGLSNFNIPRIENLTANPLKIQPAINQVELSFWNPQPRLLQWSKDHNILLEAYSPLGSKELVHKSLSVPEVKEIAQDLGITPAQVLISWHIQRGTVVLPKSVTPSRIEENYQVFKLPNDAFEKLEKAATSHKPMRQLDPGRSWGLDFDVFDENDN